jgi:hypothetical protein
VPPVKFGCGLSISVLRNLQLFTRKKGFKTDQFSKSTNFSNISNPAIWKKDRPIPLKKVPLFLDVIFLANGIDKPPSNLT